MKRTLFLMMLCLCLILGACFTTAAAADVIEISTKDQLMALVSDIAADANKYQGKTVRLKNDIDLDGATWTPIAEFKGEFDGNGKTIKNFAINAGDNRVGFFTRLGDTASVHDLTLQNVTGTVGNGRFGTLAYTPAGGSLKNVHVKNVTITTTKATAWVGGMTAWINGKTDGCTVENLTVNAANGVRYVGGFTCLVNGTQTIENCSVKGFVLNAPQATYPIGGFVAQTQTNSSHSTYKNCHVSGIDFTISGSHSDLTVGGFVGCPGGFVTAEKCTTEGKINASGATADLIGGFMGNLGWGGTYAYETMPKHSLSNCTADVDIVSGGATAGGFIGEADADLNRTNEGDTKQATFTNCKATGNVTNANGIAGGFAGKATRGEFVNCTSTGTVSGKTAGGFIGEADDWKPTYDDRCNPTSFDNKFSHDANQIKMSGCEVKGTVIGTEDAGGLVGNVGASKNGTAAEGADGKLIIKDCATSPTVVGANNNTTLGKNLNSNNNSKGIEASGLKGSQKQVVPAKEGEKLTVDSNGNIVVPAGGATVTTDDGTTTLPVGAVIHPNGSITLPGSATTVAPPKTGVDSMDKLIPLALLSLLAMVALLAQNRKARQN